MTSTKCHASNIFVGYMDMQADPNYTQGYIAGYWDGVKDAISGRTAGYQTSNLRKLPIKAMGLSARATNCLTNYGCTNVEDVIQLSTDKIRRMRNLGSKTASEIARWFIENGILCSSWSEYI